MFDYFVNGHDIKSKRGEKKVQALIKVTRPIIVTIAIKAKIIMQVLTVFTMREENDIIILKGETNVKIKIKMIVDGDLDLIMMININVLF